MTSQIETIEKVRSALETRNYKQFAECFHDDGVYERPYALKGAVSNYSGAADIYNYIAAGMAAANKLFKIISVKAEIHPCAEESVFFAEFFLSGRTFTADDAFTIASSAALIFFKDDKITKYRDFPNSAGIAQSAGTIRQYAESLTK